ncbi:hypothetical protein FJZ31_09420 [Candidatus Poribacteria bacterium]|nr:hypothetical protein [Candidatus Poribacteria bacterium]
MIHKLILGNFNSSSKQIWEISQSMKKNPVVKEKVRQILSENGDVKTNQNGEFYWVEMGEPIEIEIREFIAIPFIKGNIRFKKSLELALFLSERLGLTILLSPSKVLTKDDITHVKRDA